MSRLKSSIFSKSTKLLPPPTNSTDLYYISLQRFFKLNLETNVSKEVLADLLVSDIAVGLAYTLIVQTNAPCVYEYNPYTNKLYAVYETCSSNNLNFSGYTHIINHPLERSEFYTFDKGMVLKSFSLGTGRSPTNDVLEEFPLIKSVTSLSMHPHAETIYISTVKSGLWAYQINNSSKSLLIGGDGEQDGDFERAQIQYAAGMLFLDDDVAIVATFYSHNIKVLDLKTRQMSSLCHSSDGLLARNGNVSDCQLRYPMSALKHPTSNNLIWIAGEDLYELAYTSKSSIYGLTNKSNVL